MLLFLVVFHLCLSLSFQTILTLFRSAIVALRCHNLSVWSFVDCISSCFCFYSYILFLVNLLGSILQKFGHLLGSYFIHLFYVFIWIYHYGFIIMDGFWMDFEWISLLKIFPVQFGLSFHDLLFPILTILVILHIFIHYHIDIDIYSKLK